jgi:hypothetical protein
MPFCHQPVIAWPCTADLCPVEDPGGWILAEILAPVPHRHWTFSIPRVLRGLVERERKLLGLLSQTAYAAILKTFQALFERTHVRPGCVVSLQTFGGFGCNFHPHYHAIVTDGVFTPGGEFLPLRSRFRPGKPLPAPSPPRISWLSFSLYPCAPG